MPSRVFCPGGSLPYFSRIETKENFSSCGFFDTNFPDEMIEVLLSEKELRKLADDRSYIYKESSIDCYLVRPSTTNCNGKHHFKRSLSC